MSNPQPEPSMEEILASIRRIISEDEEAPAGVEEQQPSARQSAVVDIDAANEVFRAAKTEPEPAADVDDDSENFTMDDDFADDDFDMDAASDEDAALDNDDSAEDHLETEDVAMIKDAAVETIDSEGPMLAESSASAASKAFDSLSQTVRVSNGDGRTLEDIVTEIMKPLVKEWLDANLPAIVEEKVEREVQRLARSGC